MASLMRPIGLSSKITKMDTSISSARDFQRLKHGASMPLQARGLSSLLSESAALPSNLHANGDIMKSEATYRKEVRSLLRSNVRPLALIDTGIMLLSAAVVFCLVKFVQAVLLAW